MKYALSQHDFEASTRFLIENAFVVHGPDGTEHALAHVLKSETTETVESFSVSDVIECGLEDKGVGHKDQAGSQDAWTNSDATPATEIKQCGRLIGLAK
jgi:hypothetical protein